jgi:CBS domain-containing membrane protein
MRNVRKTTPFGTYVGRMRGSARSTSRPPLSAVAAAFCAAFIGIFLISVPSLWPGWPLSAKLFLIGSFGASAALLYAAPRSELAQPRNLLLGQLIAGVTGVTAYKLAGSHIGLASALAVASAIAIMQVTRTLHPPAGATALIAVLGPAKVHQLGYEYVLSPVLTGAAILLVVALLINNLSASESRHYPATWW